MADQHIWPVIIIGAGPQALALVSYLKCHNDSSATMDDAAHGRFMKHCGKETKHSWAQFVDASILVLDPAGGWLNQWTTQFEALNINHLRSPMMAHPDMSQESALLEHLQLHHSSALHRPVGAAIEGLKSRAGTRATRRRAKKRGGRGAMRYSNGDADPFESSVMYTRPPVPAFNEFLEDVVERTKGPTIMAVKAIGVVVNDDGSKSIELSDGNTVHCHRLVLAVGNGVPRVPTWAEKAYSTRGQPQPRILHTNDLTSMTPDDMNGKRVVVVGGGMSAAHACLQACTNAATTTMISRHDLREQEFDASLPWFSRYSAHAERCAFYQASPEDRMRKIAQARGGPSISSDVLSRLQQVMADGQVHFVQGAVTNLEVCESDWMLSLSTDKAQERDSCNCTDKNDNSESHEGDQDDVDMHADVVILATGFNTTVHGHPLLKQLYQDHAWPVVNGLPVVDSGLTWADGVHVMGSFAALGVGPDAGNLSGARRAAAMIGDVLLSALRDSKAEENDETDTSTKASLRDEKAQYRAGLNNMYMLLQVET
eukprot:m.38982 g.38982  ORF g.38982 m.38982 type:complete len:541 (+) comp12626_c1_seq5:223-1845(+)